MLIEQAEARGEPPENPLLLYSVLYGAWSTNLVAFDGDVMLTLAAQFLALAKRQGATVPLLLGHGMVGSSLLHTGSPAQGRRHLDHAIALYDPAVHRPLASLFACDLRVINLVYRSLASWFLGYPEAALADANHALKEARDTGQAGTTFIALNYAILVHFLRGNYATTEMLAEELFTLADKQDAVAWKQSGLLYRGWVFAVTGKVGNPVDHSRARRIPVNWINVYDLGWIIAAGEILRGPWPD
jgi:predicted ATPase